MLFFWCLAAGCWRRRWGYLSVSVESESRRTLRAVQFITSINSQLAAIGWFEKLKEEHRKAGKLLHLKSLSITTLYCCRIFWQHPLDNRYKISLSDCCLDLLQILNTVSVFVKFKRNINKYWDRMLTRIRQSYYRHTCERQHQKQQSFPKRDWELDFSTPSEYKFRRIRCLTVTVGWGARRVCCRDKCCTDSRGDPLQLRGLWTQWRGLSLTWEMLIDSWVLTLQLVIPGGIISMKALHCPHFYGPNITCFFWQPTCNCFYTFFIFFIAV